MNFDPIVAFALILMPVFVYLAGWHGSRTHDRAEARQATQEALIIAERADIVRTWIEGCYARRAR